MNALHGNATSSASSRVTIFVSVVQPGPFDVLIRFAIARPFCRLLTDKQSRATSRVVAVPAYAIRLASRLHAHVLVRMCGQLNFAGSRDANCSLLSLFRTCLSLSLSPFVRFSRAHAKNRKAGRVPVSRHSREIFLP